VTPALIEKGIKLGLVLTAPGDEKHSIYDSDSQSSDDER
jgi:hypothetical protein